MSLEETEYYFDERFASLTIDVDGTCWLGTNTGEIINCSNNNQQISLGEDRVYKILNSSVADSLYWVGVRNSGLQSWKISPNGSHKLQTYAINFKEDKYSPYDFVECDNMLYVATSQGLYKREINSLSDTLTLCYPDVSILRGKSGFSYVVNKLFCYRDSIVLAATESELLYVNTVNQTSKILYPGYSFDYVVVYDKIINALSQGVLYQFDLSGDMIRQIEIENNPKVYYQVNDYHFFVSTDEILLSKDLEEFVSFPLRRKIPLSGRNVIASDGDFTYLLTDRALWRLSNHMDAFKQNTAINLATTNDISTQFLSDKNDLYIQDYGDDEAKWVYRFPSSEHIKWMKAVGDDIYYVTVNNTVRKITPSTNEFKNRLFVHPIDLYKSQSKITAFDVATIHEKQVVLLGVQDGLVKVYSDGLVDTIPQFNDKYVTSIFNVENTDEIYYSTLNHGIFFESVDIPIQNYSETAHRTFINDIIVTKGFDKTLIYLTNHQIRTVNPTDSIEAKGYDGLLYLNDSVFYTLPEYGVRKMRLKDGEIVDAGLFYSDIRFDKWASFIVDDQIYLGSNLGMLVLNEGRENQGIWLTFKDPLILNWTYFTLILSFIVFLIMLWLYSKSRSNNRNGIKTKVADLKNQVKKLIDLIDIVKQNTSISAEDLLDKIEAIDLNNKNRTDLVLRLNELTQKVYDLSLEVTLLLPQRIKEQASAIASTNFYDRFNLLQEIEAIKDSKNIDDLKTQLIRNSDWLIDKSATEQNLLAMKGDLEGCVEIEGLTKGLYNEVVNLSEAMKNEPFYRIAPHYRKVVDQYNRIHSREGFAQTEECIKECTLKFHEYETSDPFIAEILLKLESFSPSRVENNVLEVLKSLHLVTKQHDCLKAIEQLNNAMNSYVIEREHLNEENEKLVNRKFDTELDSFIAEKLHEFIDNIEQSITNLYTILEETDSMILQELLKFKNHEGQQAKVLALLIASPKVKRIYIPGMLGVYGNLNPVISRLVTGKIKSSSTFLESYNKEKTIPSLFVVLMLSLLD